MKAILFYLIVKFFTDKKLNLSQPSSIELSRFILNMSYLALGIGLFSHSGAEFSGWLTKQGAPVANLQSLSIDGSEVWLFMSVILYVIMQVVKRGIEIQKENDFTI